MKKILRRIIRSIMGFFDKTVAKEAERVFDFDSQVLGGESNKGGERLKINSISNVLRFSCKALYP
jgi:hypothetical protein